MNNPPQRPLVGLTMGDIAGIGPEVIARGWLDPQLHDLARPLVVGDPAILERALSLLGSHTHIRVQTVANPEDADPSPRGSAICRRSPPALSTPAPAGPPMSF
jgi:4-hydroxy-L-threonine phosphate dehydrogenase PdxA